MKYDVILVLAGGINTNGTLPTGVIKRIQLAKQLFDKKNAPRIILSGLWSYYWDHFSPQKTEAQLMFECAVSVGIPKKNLILEENSQNTFENLYFSKKLFLEPNNWNKVIIITSDYHLKRVTKAGNEMFGSDYTIKFIDAKEQVSKIQKIQRGVKESILLYAQGFFQNFSHRRQ